jgi:hypothetical protein
LLTVVSAAAGIGAATPPARAAGKTATKGKGTSAAKPAGPTFTAEEQREIARQAEQVEGALKKIRAYKLPAGSEPATRFSVIRPPRGGKKS